MFLLVAGFSGRMGRALGGCSAPPPAAVMMPAVFAVRIAHPPHPVSNSGHLETCKCLGAAIRMRAALLVALLALCTFPTQGQRL